MSARIHRRRFLGHSTTLAASMALASHSSAAQQPAREPLRLGIIGVNGRGLSNLDGVAHENIVALCDVDASRSAPIRKRFPKASYHEDYRRLIDQKDIQAVVISAPAHHHVFAALAAMRAGKHVYCEKPLAHSVAEVRAMMAEAARSKVVTQMGAQIHAGDNYRRVLEIIQAGTIGPIRRVHVWCDRRVDVGQL